MEYKTIQSIYDWNRQAGLLNKPYSDELESSMLIEEALEGSYNMDQLAIVLNEPGYEKIEYTPKAVARAISSIAYHDEFHADMSEVDRFDKHLDSIFINFGSLFKLGLTVEEAMIGLAVVTRANQAKLGHGQDSNGKQIKPTNFVGPEPQLQQILDERG